MYFLYESNGKRNLIPWDYNLAFGGMGQMGGGNDVRPGGGELPESFTGLQNSAKLKII